MCEPQSLLSSSEDGFSTLSFEELQSALPHPPQSFPNMIGSARIFTIAGEIVIRINGDKMTNSSSRSSKRTPAFRNKTSLRESNAVRSNGTPSTESDLKLSSSLIERFSSLKTRDSVGKTFMNRLSDSQVWIEIPVHELES